MSHQSLPLPISHSAAYYEYHRSFDSSSPAYYYPPSALARPPAAYVSQSRQSPAEGHRGEPFRMKTSVSSSTSDSSGASDLKIYPPIQPYRFGSQTERGLMEDTLSRHSWGPPKSNNLSGRNVGRSEMVENHSAVIRYIQHDESDDEPEEKDHAIWILFWLSFLDPFHSLFSCLFSILTLLALIILSPLRLCQKGETFSTTLIRTVAPVFRNHLQMIYAPSVKKAHNFDFSTTALILVHVASPIFSLGLAFFAWIAAVFWLFALIMGNPDGTERGDDGRATVLGARNYLEKYLLSALRNKP